MFEDPKSKISQLERVLDAREDRVTKRIKRHELHNRDITVNQKWDDSEFETAAEAEGQEKGPKGISFSLKVLIGSIIFFVIALGLVAYKFLGESNLVSGNKIEITVKAPISVAGGEILSFEIEIKNNNTVTLVGSDLGVTFSAGAKDAIDTSLPAKRVQDFIGDILPGQSIKKNLSVALFGEENEKKEINISLEYKIAGSNSLFNKNKVVSVLISSSPVSIVVSGPTEVNTNQTVDFTVEVISNSPTMMKNLLLKVAYPPGFSFSNSTPNTFSKNNLWLVGDLEPGAKRIIKFSGVLSGQEAEERGFNFNIGTQSKSDNLTIDVPFSSHFSSITIRRPFVSADIFFNDSNATEYISSAGAKIDALIKWQNNLAYEVSDVSIVVKISGNAVDKSSIRVDGGLYKSIDNTIVFNKATDSDLASLDPGKEGTSRFSFSSFNSGTVTGSSLTNPIIVLSISVQGRRIGYGSNQEDALFSDTRKVKITSDPQIFAKSLYFVGPFKNTGPVPPKAETETTYTITWTVTNPLNNLSNVKVNAILPPYIKWLGIISPEKEKMDYDEGTGSLVWNIGNVLAGAGTISPAREVSFQISFLPSVDQIKLTPDLVGEMTLSARDNFTLSTVTDTFQAINIRLSSDPYFKVGDEAVVQ